MAQMSIEQFVAVVSSVVGVLGIVLAMRRDSSAERRHLDAIASERAAERQVMNDKIDSQTEMLREVRDTTREMSRQLQDHSRELATLESRMGDIDRRLTVVERRCERRVDGGDAGTD